MWLISEIERGIAITKDRKRRKDEKRGSRRKIKTTEGTNGIDGYKNR